MRLHMPQHGGEFARLVHHAEILALKGDSYRLRDKDLGAPPPGD
jgi:DNA replication protein DnaC